VLLQLGTEIYFQDPKRARKKALHRATLVELANGRAVVELLPGALRLSPGQELLVYYAITGQLMRQTVKVERVEQKEVKLYVTCRPVDDPVPAEDRECYRVSMLTADVEVSLGEERRLSLIDMSVTGFAVLAHEVHHLGMRLPASIGYEGKTYRGTVRVQSARPSGDQVRYGLRVLAATGKGENLEKGLQHITMRIQRAQLRRLSGHSA